MQTTATQQQPPARPRDTRRTNSGAMTAVFVAVAVAILSTRRRRKGFCA